MAADLQIVTKTLERPTGGRSYFLRLAFFSTGFLAGLATGFEGFAAGFAFSGAFALTSALGATTATAFSFFPLAAGLAACADAAAALAAASAAAFAARPRRGAGGG